MPSTTYPAVDEEEVLVVVPSWVEDDELLVVLADSPTQGCWMRKSQFM